MTHQVFCSPDLHISLYTRTTYQVVRGTTYQVVHGHKWQDGKQQRLEDCLGDFIANLRRVAVAFKLRRQAEEERARAAQEAERRRWEEQKRRWEEEERQREEKRRRDEFDAEVARWRRAKDIRDYVHAALQVLDKRGSTDASEEAHRQRLLWALEYADKLDPLN